MAGDLGWKGKGMEEVEGVVLRNNLAEREEGSAEFAIFAILNGSDSVWRKKKNPRRKTLR